MMTVSLEYMQEAQDGETHEGIYSPCVIALYRSEGLAVVEMPLTAACGYNKKLTPATTDGNTNQQH